MPATSQRPAAAARRTTILLPAELSDRLDRLARPAGGSKTALIARAVAAYVEAAESPPAPLPFVAIGSSGHGRLSLDAGRIAARELGDRSR